MNLPALPERIADSHKGTYGRALVVAGSRGMSGAATMTALAALRTGAGLVTVATPNSCVNSIASFHPSYMVLGLEETDDGQLASAAHGRLKEICEQMTCVAIGPGLGLGADVQRLVRALYTELPLPMVIDADGIAAIASVDSPAPSARILTPHLGEFRRLSGTADMNREQTEAQAFALAGRMSATILLKGHVTLVTDGEQQYQNMTGNAGMATAGSGDVLTGVILGLVAQGMPAYDAAVLGAHLHGMAGDMAAEGLGMHALIATDLIDYLPSALMEHDETHPPA